MFIAVDDTDSRQGMCTTYLMTEIIERSNLDVIGFPRLVRLNPSIKFKTRGNGALVANLAYGSGHYSTIGEIRGKTLKSYQNAREEAGEEDLLKIASEVIEELAVLEEPETNPGVVVSRNKFPEEFYWKAVREEVTIEDTEHFIKSNGGNYGKFKNGRGIIGAAGAISWPALNRTYEMIAYRGQIGSNPDTGTMLKIAECADGITGTFNNVDRRNRYPAIFPSDRTPVIAGVRGKIAEPIIREFPLILSDNGVNYERMVCFETNQASDDHLNYNGKSLKDGQSFNLKGIVISYPHVIEGSHYFAGLNSNLGKVHMAAFEPTKEFREVFSKLIPGDYVSVYGTYANETLNTEKLEVLSLAENYRRTAPICDNCGRKMTNNGKEDFRCRSCKARKTMPHYIKYQRELKQGKYDVPVIARRHLSRPFEMDKAISVGKEAVTF